MTPTTETNRKYCLFGRVVDFKSHEMFKGTPEYWKMTLIDYLTLFAWWIILIRTWWAYKGFQNPYSDISWYEEERTYQAWNKIQKSKTTIIRRNLKRPK